MLKKCHDPAAPSRSLSAKAGDTSQAKPCTRALQPRLAGFSIGRTSPWTPLSPRYCPSDGRSSERMKADGFWLSARSGYSVRRCSAEAGGSTFTSARGRGVISPEPVDSRGRSSVVEPLPSKQLVVGSIPTVRSKSAPPNRGAPIGLHVSSPRHGVRNIARHRPAWRMAGT